MKFKNLTRAMLPAGFVFGLFSSPQSFVLTAADHSVVGQGTFEEVSDNVAQMKVTIHGQEFTGNGVIRENSGPSILSKLRQGVRSDRALSESLGTKHQKYAKTFVTSKDGTTLACDLNIFDSEIAGQCLNPENQQILTVKTVSGDHQ